MNLRDYQQACTRAVFDGFPEYRSQLVVMPTGTGKTVVFAAMVRDWSGRAMVIAHREELISQAADKMVRCGVSGVSIEMAESRSDEDVPADYRAKAVIASVQSLSRPQRLARFAPNDFSLLVIDEAHHSVSASYRTVIDHFQQNPASCLVGVTATPRRADDIAMGQVYERVAYEYSIEDAINDGWLVPVRQRVVRVEGLDFSNVRTTAGDLNEGDLERILSEEKHLHKVAAPTVELAGDNPTLVFCVTVNHATLLAEVINRYKPESAIVLSGKTDREERRRHIERFRNGEIQFMCNCALFSEGFDAPATACVVMARPTKSLALYCQTLGRGTRPLPDLVDGLASPAERRNAIAASDKPSMTVLDFVGNSGRHKIVTAADVLGGKYGTPIRQRAKDLAEDGILSVQDALEEAEEDVALFGEQEEFRKRIRAKAEYSTANVSPFVGGGKSMAAAADLATPNQVRFLVRLGIREETACKMRRRQASVVIAKKLKEKNAAG